MDATSVFSPRALLLGLALAVAGVVAGSVVPGLGTIARYLGLVVAGFAFGLLRSDRRYLEAGLAGALAAGAGFLLSLLSGLPFAAALASEAGIAVAGVGVGTGAVCALAGHYFGRDLRSGLTRELGRSTQE